LSQATHVDRQPTVGQFFTCGLEFLAL
jgi:hypothetical protein